MDFRQLLNQALSNLFASKLRSFLAVLGILVGTASVVALISSGELATAKALEQFKTLGSDLLSVSLFESDLAQKKSDDAKTISLKEAQEMAQGITQIKAVAPYITVYVPLTYEGRQLQGSVIGATSALQDVLKITMQSGRFVSFLDHQSYFAVIGNRLANQIKTLGVKNPLNTQIRLGKNVFNIIGVLNKQPESSFFNEDLNSSVIIPLQVTSVLSKYAKIRNLVMSMEKDSDIDDAEKQINNYVAQHASGLKTFIRSAKQIIQSMANQHQIFTMLLGSIGGISLLVGGIGVMNIMLVSVAERRREIGIRMAVGAKRKDILKMFLFESIVLALFGGIFGVLLGLSISFAIAYFGGWGFHIFLFPPVVGFVVSASTGIFFGLYPAYRAAGLDPIDALRYE